ncbi:MAG: hypothetical protein HRT45_17410 [Bdellovibrionales bacterium]|nr:hypothetical protein [Bdellovibrionales bacterium]
MITKSAQNCLIWSLTLLVLPLTFGTPAYSAGPDDDGVEIEVQGPGDDDEGFRPPNTRSRKGRFGKKRDNDRDSGRTRVRSSSDDNRSNSRSRSRGSQPRTGPGNARFGKTEGKVRFILVNDPAKKLREESRNSLRDSEGSTFQRKKISLGPDSAPTGPLKPMARSQFAPGNFRKQQAKPLKPNLKPQLGKFGKPNGGKRSR